MNIISKFFFILALSTALACRAPIQDLFNTDFEHSLGKNDPYQGKFYNECLKVLKQNKDGYFYYLQPYSGARFLQLCRNLYHNNKGHARSNNTGTRIPRTIHQIWIGNKPLPEKNKQWQQTWQNWPGWEYKLWTDQDVEQLNLINKKQYDAEKNMGARADILRLEILTIYGGIYVDTDFECLNPEFFNLLTSSFDFFCGMQPLDRKRLVITNAIIGAIPHHPVISACLQNFKDTPSQFGDFLKIVNNGPGLLSRMVFLHAGKKYRDLILPPTFFYPLGVEQIRTEPYVSMPNTVAKLKKVKSDVCKPESVALHWWENSWKLPEAWQ